MHATDMEKAGTQTNKLRSLLRDRQVTVTPREIIRKTGTTCPATLLAMLRQQLVWEVILKRRQWGVWQYTILPKKTNRDRAILDKHLKKGWVRT